MAYQSIFDRMNRTQKREFDRSPVQEKMKVFAEEYQRACMDKAQDEIVNSFYRGYLQAYKMLTENYLNPIAESEDEMEIIEIFAKMVEEIKRTGDMAAREFEKLSKKDEE